MLRVRLVLALPFVLACSDLVEPAPPLDDNAPPAFALIVEEPVQLTTNAATQARPDISGDLVVWSDSRSGTHGGNKIFLYDLARGIEFKVADVFGGADNPAVSGNRIVWFDHRNGNADIFMCDWDGTTCPHVQITSNPSGQFLPDVSGNLIAWFDTRNNEYGDVTVIGNNDIYACEWDGATCPEVQVTTDPANIGFNTAVSGTRIVWADKRHVVPGEVGTTMLYMCEWSGSACPEVRLTFTGFLNQRANISGNRIAWWRLDGINWLYVLDLTTGIEEPITSHPTYGFQQPGVYGDRITWGDFRDGDWNVYLRDLATDEEVRVTSDPSTQRDPVVAGENVVWMDERTGNWDLFLARVFDGIDPTVEDISSYVDDLVADGSLNDTGVADVLHAFLDQAGAASSRGNSEAAARTLEAMIRFVEAQSGRSLEPEAAEQLLQALRTLVSELRTGS